MNRTEQALTTASRALRDATFAFERTAAGADFKDLPTGAAKALGSAFESMTEALKIIEGYRPNP